METRATRVYCDEILEDGARVFRTLFTPCFRFVISSFEDDGLAIISRIVEESDMNLFEYLIGCFEEGSNFAYELMNSFPEDSFGRKNLFKGFKVYDYQSGAAVIVTKGLDPEELYEEFEARIEELSEREEKLVNMYYHGTRINLENDLKWRHRKVELGYPYGDKNEALEIEKKIKMRFKNAELKAQWDNLPEGQEKTYAQLWAKYMQHFLKNDKTDIGNIAELASQKADLSGYPMHSYKAAAALISYYWIHGDEFKQWYKDN